MSKAARSCERLSDDAMPRKTVDNRLISSAQIPPRTDGGAAKYRCFLPCGCRGGVPWYCIRTLYNSEVLAEVQLRQRGFCAWVPMEYRRRDNGQGIIRPLFLRYGFVQLDLAEDLWRTVFGTRGVEWLFCTPAQRPIAVPGHDIEALMAQAAPNGIIYPGAPKASGGHRGPSWRAISELSDADREALLLRLFGEGGR